jgi:hypothetical protein
MNGNRERTALEGSLLRVGETREIAIYRRGGVAWIADFRAGAGELFTPGEWFALNGASALRRASSAPLPAEAIGKIERLHGVAPLAKQTKQERPSREIFRMQAFARLQDCFASGE